jgi:glycosyltransferase involved in cell wall biosynthesis
MVSDPLVSIVMPTYNRADVIGETIKSILAQHLRNFELVVISDGSTDNTEAVVESYRDSRIKLVKQTNSGGPARPRNTGVEYAKGKYIAFCDDDDLWMPEKLQRQVEVMEQQSDAALCFTGGVTFGDRDLLSKRAVKKGVDRDHFQALLYGNFIANSSVLVRKSVLEEVGPFNIEKFLHGAEDYEMWLRIAHRYRLVRIDEPLIRYRVHRNNLARNRALATRRSIYIVRNLHHRVTLRGSVFLPLLWQRLKYAIYAIARR